MGGQSGYKGRKHLCEDGQVTPRDPASMALYNQAQRISCKPDVTAASVGLQARWGVKFNGRWYDRGYDGVTIVRG